MSYKEPNNNNNMLLGLGILILSLVFVFTANDVNISVIDPNSLNNIIINDSDGVDVFIQDQHTEIINLKLTEFIEHITLLNNYDIGDRTIRIQTNGTTPTNILTLNINEGIAFYQARPINVTSLGANQYELYLDSPLDYPFTINAESCLGNSNLAVDGSITPRIFQVSPEHLNNNISWDITGIHILFGGIGIGPSNDAPDDADFFITDAITNGLILRSVNGITKNIFNIKTTGDLRSIVDNVEYVPKTKAGVYTVSGQMEFSINSGVTIRLNANDNSSFEIIVEDDLTEMTGGQARVHGHVVD